MKDFKTEALLILEKIYSGSNHIGDVYNQEALEALYQLHLEEVREVIEKEMAKYPFESSGRKLLKKLLTLLWGSVLE